MKRISIWAGAALLSAALAGCSKEQETPPAPAAAPAVQDAAPAAGVAGKSGAEAGTGTITGRVVFKGPHKPALLPVGKDKDVCGTSKDEPSLLVGAQNGLKNAVVQVIGSKGAGGKTPEPVLDQIKCEYEPHVLVIPAGATVKIKNSDGILHNVHTYSKINSPFNKAQPKFLKEFEHSFEKPEAIQVKCDVHGWMSGWIVVTEAGHYDVSNAEGSFTLADVPAGEHKVEVWHETLGTQTRTVKVAPGETREAVFEFSGKTS